MSEFLPREFIVATGSAELKRDDDEKTVWSIQCRKREEIVRCRDCIYYKQDPDPIDPGWPMMCERTGDDMVEPYGFCTWAVRREVDA